MDTVTCNKLTIKTAFHKQYHSFSGPRPLDIFLKAIPYRLLFGFVAAFLVWITPKIVPDSSQGLPFSYYIILLVCYAIHQVLVIYQSVMLKHQKTLTVHKNNSYNSLWKVLREQELKLHNTCLSVAKNFFFILIKKERDFSSRDFFSQLR